MHRDVLRALPSVQTVLRAPTFVAAARELAPAYRTRLVRHVVERYRRNNVDESAARVATDIIAACVNAAEALAQTFPRRVINGTGVLIHTNLGRAPLGDLLTNLDVRALAGYTDLEWDAESQGRGDRDATLRQQLQLLTGAESAIVVNNCAGALLLALQTIAVNREVAVSRSELVEIGGSFRVPEIMAASGCRLREVGTTNRTRIADFEQAATAGVAALLKVHQSNFVQRGFVEQVDVDALVALGRRTGVPVIEDNGSGLIDADGLPAALFAEPQVAASLAAGVDIVCCSADKLLGGVQAGLLLGRADLIAAMRRSPLFRALRLDKVRHALLGKTLGAHLSGRRDAVPLWRLFHTPLHDLAARLERLRLPDADTGWASCQRVSVQGTLGGGTNPESEFPSLGLELTHRALSADAVRRQFAARTIPIVGYVRHDRFHLDIRTIFDDDLLHVQQALDEVGDVHSA